MGERRKEQSCSLWQHISYVSVPPDGWQCRERRGDISAPDLEQLVRYAVTNFVSHKQLSSVPTPAEIADSPRIFRYRFVAGAGFFVHAAQAGYDGSGRPNNVWSQVLKCADVTRMGAYPVEFWRSASFCAPYGMQAVMEQKLDAEPAPVPGSLVTVVNEGAFIFSDDAETWRQGVLAVLLDAVYMRQFEGGKPIVLVAKSQDEAALWIGAICRLIDPSVVTKLSFSLYEREAQVERMLSDGYDIVCVPYEDTDMLYFDNAVVIHTYKDCELGDAETGKPHMTYGGFQVPVSAWSVAMFDEVASETDYADFVGLLRLPVSAQTVTNSANSTLDTANIPASQTLEDNQFVESAFLYGSPGLDEESDESIEDAIKSLLDDYQGQEIPPKLINLLRFLDDGVLSDAFASSAGGVSLQSLALHIVNRDKGNRVTPSPAVVWANARILAEKLLLNESIVFSRDLQVFLADFIENYKFRVALNKQIAYDLFGSFYVFSVITDFFDSLSGDLGEAVLYSFSLDSETLKTAVEYAREGFVKQNMLAWRKANLLSPDMNSMFMHKIFAFVVMFRNRMLDAHAQEVLGAGMFGSDMSLIRLCYLFLLEEGMANDLFANVENLVASVEKIILHETDAGAIADFNFNLRDKILNLIDDCRNYRPMEPVTNLFKGD